MATAEPLDTIADMQQMEVTDGASVQIPEPTVSSGVKQPEKVVLQTLTTNDASVFCKNNSNVAIDGSTGGYELPPGSNIVLPITEYRTFYCIAATGTQKVQVTFLAG
jgi:hypothetical protein